MQRICGFREWASLKEMADYGFEKHSNKPQGGTENPTEEGPLHVVKSNLIMDELVRHPIGKLRPKQKFEDTIIYGDGPGSLLIEVTPLGSEKIVIRRLVKDLIGENTWICKHVYPIGDNKDRAQEIPIAHDMHDILTEISKEMVEGPAKEFDGLEKLSWSLWQAAKRDHPSYVMFPVALRRQSDNYYKLVFEFKGHGVEKMRTGGRAEQFDIDVYWDKTKGMIRIWGYDLQSSMRQHDWKVGISEFNEYFSPGQPREEIVKNVIHIFLKY
jgi:hypothetical protein